MRLIPLHFTILLLISCVKGHEYKIYGTGHFETFNCSELFVSSGHVIQIKLILANQSTSDNSPTSKCFCALFVDSSMPGWSGRETIAVASDETKVALAYTWRHYLSALINPAEYLWNAYASMRLSSVVTVADGARANVKVKFGDNVAEFKLSDTEAQTVTADFENFASPLSCHPQSYSAALDGAYRHLSLQRVAREHENFVPRNDSFFYYENKPITTEKLIASIAGISLFFFIVVGFAGAMHFKRQRDMRKEEEQQERRRIEMMQGKGHGDEAELYRIYRRSIAAPMESHEILEAIHQDILVSDISDEPAQTIPAAEPRWKAEKKQSSVLALGEVDDAEADEDGEESVSEASSPSSSLMSGAGSGTEV